MRNQQEDKTELHAVAPIEKKTKLVGQLRLRPGQKCFELDLSTQLITEAKFEIGTVDFGKVTQKEIGQLNHRLQVRENCLYVCAISAQRADYKFMKMLGLNPVKLKKPNGKYTVVPAAVLLQAVSEGQQEDRAASDSVAQDRGATP